MRKCGGKPAVRKSKQLGNASVSLKQEDGGPTSLEG